jgi:hypothetical protein
VRDQGVVYSLVSPCIGVAPSPTRCAVRCEAAGRRRSPRISRAHGGTAPAAGTRIRSAPAPCATPAGDPAPRPDEAVYLAHHDPRAGFVEAQPPLNHGGDLDCLLGALRRAVRHGHDRDDRIAAHVLRRQHKSAGAVLEPFLPAFLKLGVPQVGIGDDEAEIRGGKRHTRPISARRRDGRGGGPFSPSQSAPPPRRSGLPP